MNVRWLLSAIIVVVILLLVIFLTFPRLPFVGKIGVVIIATVIIQAWRSDRGEQKQMALLDEKTMNKKDRQKLVEWQKRTHLLITTQPMQDAWSRSLIMWEIVRAERIYEDTVSDALARAAIAADIDCLITHLSTCVLQEGRGNEKN